MSEPRELLGVTEDELQLEPCPVDVEDVSGGERQVRGEEHLSGLSLLVRVKVVNDDNPHFTLKADRPDICGVQFIHKLVIHRVLFLEDVHVKVLEVNFPGKLLGTPSFPGLRTTIEILQVYVIAEAAYGIEAQFFDTGNEALLGEVSVSHNEITDGQQLFVYAAQHPQIPPREGIGIIHPLGAFGLPPTAFGSEGLLRFQEHGILGICINNREPQYLKIVFDGTGAARPEPVHAWGLLTCLGDEAWIDAYCDAVSHHWRKEVAVERKPVEGLLEVLAEPALTRVGAPRHLGEVHASGGCEKQLHGIDDELFESFA